MKEDSPQKREKRIQLLKKQVKTLQTVLEKCENECEKCINLVRLSAYIVNIADINFTKVWYAAKSKKIDFYNIKRHTVYFYQGTEHPSYEFDKNQIYELALKHFSKDYVKEIRSYIGEDHPFIRLLKKENIQEEESKEAEKVLYLALLVWQFELIKKRNNIFQNTRRDGIEFFEELPLIWPILAINSPSLWEQKIQIDMSNMQEDALSMSKKIDDVINEVSPLTKLLLAGDESIQEKLLSVSTSEIEVLEQNLQRIGSAVQHSIKSLNYYIMEDGKIESRMLFFLLNFELVPAEDRKSIFEIVKESQFCDIIQQKYNVYKDYNPDAIDWRFSLNTQIENNVLPVEFDGLRREREKNSFHFKIERVLLEHLYQELQKEGFLDNGTDIASFAYVLTGKKTRDLYFFHVNWIGTLSSLSIFLGLLKGRSPLYREVRWFWNIVPNLFVNKGRTINIKSLSNSFLKEVNKSNKSKDWEVVESILDSCCIIKS